VERNNSKQAEARYREIKASGAILDFMALQMSPQSNREVHYELE
jgi:hypothetical protein